MSELHTWARRYAKLGWYIFPLRPLGREPLTPNGFHDASNDLAQIDRWWAETPDANIGVYCGKSGIVVLDVDTKDGKTGGASLIAIIGTDDSLLGTPTAVTWSGGRHYFYAGAHERRIGKLGKDLDICGGEGYVVLAPSVVHQDGKKGAYAWTHRDGERPPFLPYPDLFRVRDEEPPGPVREVVRITKNRNMELTRRAGLYRRIGMSVSAIEAALRVDNEAMCEEPLPLKEIADIAKSIGKKAPDRAASVLPAALVAPPHAGKVMTDEEFLSSCEVETAWRIEGFVQRSGILLLSALPKVGKSDLARNMALSVATGGLFLGRRATKGKVLWIGLAEPKQKLFSAIETMGLMGHGISWVITRPPGPWQPWLAEVIEQTKADFVVIDEIGRLASDLESINDYTQVVRTTQPFLDLRARFGTTFCLIHHNNKLGGTAGSTAWEGAVDCIMSLSRSMDNTRTIQTKQRLGEDLEPTILVQDPATGLITAPISKVVVEQRRAEQALLDLLSTGSQFTRQQLADSCCYGAHIGRRAVDALVSAGLLQAIGAGVKGEPRIYRLRGVSVKSNPSYLSQSSGKQTSKRSREGASDEDSQYPAADKSGSPYEKTSPEEAPYHHPDGPPSVTLRYPKKPDAPEDFVFSTNGHSSKPLLDYVDDVFGSPPRDGELPY